MPEIELDPQARTEYDVYLLGESVKAVRERAVSEQTMECAQRELASIAEAYFELGDVLALLRSREERRAA